MALHVCPVCGKIFQALGWPRHRMMHIEKGEW
jgi:hypothetical protein